MLSMHLEGGGVQAVPVEVVHEQLGASNSKQEHHKYQ